MDTITAPLIRDLSKTVAFSARRSSPEGDLKVGANVALTFEQLPMLAISPLVRRLRPSLEWQAFRWAGTTSVSPNDGHCAPQIGRSALCRKQAPFNRKEKPADE